MRDAFLYPTFAAYVEAVNAARPAVNVGALIGHTALRNNQMDRLDRAATPSGNRRHARATRGSAGATARWV